MAATLLMPEAEAALVGGKASVMMADELAKSMAPPTPWPIRMAISQMAAGRPGEPGDRQQDREDGEDGEAEVVHLDPAEHVPDPAQGHDQHGQARP